MSLAPMVMVMSFGAKRSLSESRDTYYERARFGDVWSDAARAPMTLVPEIAAAQRGPAAAQVDEMLAVG